MKRLLIFTSFIFMIMFLVACSDDEASKDGKIELDFWVFGATNYEDLAAEYEKQNSGIKIKVKTSETEEHHNSLFNALSAGSGAPDIVMIEVDQFDRLKQAQDRFVNLYDLGAKDIQDKYLDWKWKMGENSDGDFLFGLPTDIGPKAMYYRIDVFEEAGLPTDPDEVEALIQTVDDFIEVGKQIKEKTGKPMLDSMEMAYRAVIDGAEESFFDKDGNLLIENPGNSVREAFDFAVELDSLGLVEEYTMWTPEWGNAVNNGEFAIELGAAWLKGWMAGNAPDAKGMFRVATLPEELAGNWGGSYIAIPSETKHKEEAYKFIEWMLSPENQLESFKSEAGLFPSAVDVYEMEEFKNTEDEFFGGQSTAQYFAKAAEDISYIYKGENYVSVHNEILTALQNVQQGADPDEEWDDAVERIKGIVNK